MDICGHGNQNVAGVSLLRFLGVQQTSDLSHLAATHEATETRT
jgi:hypothetical protein